MKNRQRLVYRLDMLFFISLLLTSGLAVILFFYQYYFNDDKKQETAIPATSAVLPSPTATITATLTATATFTLTLPPLVISPLSVDEIQAGEPLTITGNAQPGTTITLYDGDEIIGETSAGSNGGWSITLPEGLEEGPHELSIQAVGPDGTSSQQAPVGFEVSSSAPTPTRTPIPTATATIIPSHTPQPTSTSSPTQTATRRPTQTPVPTATATIIPSHTPQPTSTPSPTQTATRRPTQTPLLTITATIAPSTTPQPTITPTTTQTATQRPTQTPVPTATATRQPSLTPVPTLIAMIAPSSTPQPTVTPNPSQTTMPTNTATPTATFSPIPPSKTPIQLVISPTTSRPNGGAAVGQIPTSKPVDLATEAIVIRPRIDAPANGETYAPGTITVRGIGQPGAIVEIIDQDAGTTLTAVPIGPDSSWETAVVLEGTGKKTLVAAIPAADGMRLLSDPVQITLAPPVQPQTGLTGDPDETGRTFTALLALLLAAGGFSAYFAGRLLYLVAHDRLKPR